MDICRGYILKKYCSAGGAVDGVKQKKMGIKSPISSCFCGKGKKLCPGICVEGILADGIT